MQDLEQTKAAFENTRQRYLRRHSTLLTWLRSHRSCTRLYWASTVARDPRLIALQSSVVPGPPPPGLDSPSILYRLDTVVHYLLSYVHTTTSLPTLKVFFVLCDEGRIIDFYVSRAFSSALFRPLNFISKFKFRKRRHKKNAIHYHNATIDRCKLHDETQHTLWGTLFPILQLGHQGPCRDSWHKKWVE